MAHECEHLAFWYTYTRIYMGYGLEPAALIACGTCPASTLGTSSAASCGSQ